MTIQDVAHHLHVGWETVKGTQQKQDLQRRFLRSAGQAFAANRHRRDLHRRGHRYLTVVLDLESGAVVFVGKGKGADALLPFWRRLRAARARIEAVAMDMSAAYITAVETWCPQAEIVFDHFSTIVKLLNEKLSDLRRELHREASDVLAQASAWAAPAGCCWKNLENLEPDRNEPASLGRSSAAECPAGHGLLHEGRPAAIVGAAEQARGGELLDPLARTRHGLGHPADATIRPHFARAQLRHPDLVRLPHLHGPLGRHQQQNQNHAATGLRLPRPRVLHPQDVRPPRK